MGYSEYCCYGVIIATSFGLFWHPRIRFHNFHNNEANADQQGHRLFNGWSYHHEAVNGRMVSDSERSKTRTPSSFLRSLTLLEAKKGWVVLLNVR